jgi:hypothetical protein
LEEKTMAEPQVVTKINPQLRSGLTAAATGIGAATSAVMWLSTHSVDIYAIIDKMNTALTQAITLITTLSAIATMAISVWNARPSKKIADAVATGKVEGVVVNDPALASKLGPEVQTSVQQLPIAAQISPGSMKTA